MTSCCSDSRTSRSSSSMPRGLHRNLNLVLQVMEITDRIVVCLNLMDEAKRHGIAIDHERLVPRTRRAGRVHQRPLRPGTVAIGRHHSWRGDGRDT